MALAIDSSTPALLTQNAVFLTSLASNSFSPPAGSLLVVLVGFPSSANTVGSITDSLGSHLTYTKLVAHAAGATDMEIWVADCASAQTGMTVTVNFNSCKSQCIGVAVMTGAKAAASQTGATATADPASPPTITVTGTTAGSFVIAGFGDFASGNTPTPASGQTDSFNSHSYFFSDGGGGGDGCWFQTTTATTSGGSVTINDSAPTNSTHVAAAEILAGGASPADLGTPTAAGVSSASSLVTAATFFTEAATAVTAASAPVTAAALLTGQAAAVTAAAAPLTAAALLSPSATGVTSATAAMTAQALLAPAATGVTAATANLTAATFLAPAATGVTSATASVTAPGAQFLTPTASAVSAASEPLTAATFLTPTATAATSATAAVTIPGSGTLLTRPMMGVGL